MGRTGDKSTIQQHNSHVSDFVALISDNDYVGHCTAQLLFFNRDQLFVFFCEKLNKTLTTYSRMAKLYYNFHGAEINGITPCFYFNFILSIESLLLFDSHY